jgi:hypothetical protein
MSILLTVHNPKVGTFAQLALSRRHLILGGGGHHTTPHHISVTSPQQTLKWRLLEQSNEAHT